MAVEQFDHCRTDRAQAEHPEFHPFARHIDVRLCFLAFLLFDRRRGRLHYGPALTPDSAATAGALIPPNALRMPRTACRVRCSFSINAKRT